RRAQWPKPHHRCGDEVFFACLPALVQGVSRAGRDHARPTWGVPLASRPVVVTCCWHEPASWACAGKVAPPPLGLETRALGVPSVLPEWRAPRLHRPCPWATQPRTAQDAPRVEVDLVHDATAVRLDLDADDALRALVLHETQGIV